ncbi:MAG: Ig-like domain-containing protein [Oscillospiraceae bacterium]|nr:Ig-like domain-containing protein [Oscillospiraceae bacterium]
MTSVGSTTQLGTSHFPIEVVGPVEWSSTDESICTVDSNGLVTATGTGTGSIIARMYGKAVECKVYVT